MAALQISYKDPRQLRPRARNPRTHTPKQIKQIATSIKEFGFISPVRVDATDAIIAGHGRVEAAKLIGMGDVPTVRVDHLSAAQIRAYVTAKSHGAGLSGTRPDSQPILKRPIRSGRGLLISSLATKSS